MILPSKVWNVRNYEGVLASEELRGQDHPLSRDGSLNEHNTSTHNPFGTGRLNFDKLAPALNTCGVPHDWWAVDLCFWPDAWTVTADSKTFLDGLRRKYPG